MSCWEHFRLIPFPVGGKTIKWNWNLHFFSPLCAEGTLLFAAELGTSHRLETVALSLLPAWPGPHISGSRILSI